MPKAFTYICEKINISLFDNTITVYPKMSTDGELTCLSFLIIEYNGLLSSIPGGNLITAKDSNHQNYHQDNLDFTNPHFHLQFSKTLDEEKLKEVLKIFVIVDIISEEEQLSFIESYNKANQIPTLEIRNCIYNSAANLLTWATKPLFLFFPTSPTEGSDKIITSFSKGM